MGNTCFLVGNEDLSKEAKIAVFKIMFLSTLLNESESWFRQEQPINGYGILKCLKIRRDRVMNE